MTERGLPSDGAPACPFVAFEDDRDARSTVPDHRHRCFAEARPAPRALAHQEAYCLSSAFPVCPTFQDWARREAAAARPAPGSRPSTRDDALAASPATPPLDREPEDASGYAGGPVPAQRNPTTRDWAAPPPWTGDPGGAPGTAAGAAAMGAAAAGSMQSDSAEDDQFADDDRVDDVPVIAPRPGSPSAAAPVAGGSPTPSDVASRGLAGSAAYRLAGPDPDEPEPATPQRDDDRDRMSGAPAAAAATAWAASPPGRQGSSPNAGPSSAQASAARTPASPAHADQHATAGQGPEPGARGRSDASELFGPAWEAPRRYEAYPTLRTRVGLPSFAGVPRLAIAAVGLVLAAVLVFYFGPMLLGFGKSDQSGGGSGATPTPTVSASETPVPTVAPPPTPQVYIVAKGDTFSKIARKLGVTVEVLKAANPQIKNIDKIQIGDQVNIPQAIQSGGDASAQP